MALKGNRRHSRGRKAAIQNDLLNAPLVCPRISTTHDFMKWVITMRKVNDIPDLCPRDINQILCCVGRRNGNIHNTVSIRHAQEASRQDKTEILLCVNVETEWNKYSIVVKFGNETEPSTIMGVSMQSWNAILHFQDTGTQLREIIPSHERRRNFSSIEIFIGYAHVNLSYSTSLYRLASVPC